MAQALDFQDATGSPVTVGDSPQALATGDLDQDGVTDLVVAEGGTADDVRVLLGDGSGGFTDTGSPVAVGDEPSAVALDDVDGDGNLDAVVADANDDDVRVLLGDGTGDLTDTGTPIAVGDNPSALALGQIDGGTDLDLVVADANDDDVRVLLGDGSGGFTDTGSPVAVGDSPSAVALGNLDAGTDLDLVVADAGTSDDVRVFLGDGSGGFTASGSPVVVGNDPSALALANVDSGNTNLDAIVADAGANDARVLLGNGSGGLSSTTTVTVGTTPRALAVGNLNDDTKLDFAVANSGSDDVSVLLGTGSGGFVTASGSAFDLTSGAAPLALVSEDFDGDTRDDLAVADTGADSVQSLLNTDTPLTLTPTSTTLTAATEDSSYSADFDSSGGDSTVTFSATSLPSGLSLSSSTGALTGTPTTAGSYSFTVTAADAFQSVNRTYSLTVTAASSSTSVTLSPSSLDDATVGTFYSRAITASGGSGTATFSVSSGSLPSGLSLSSSGFLTGTPASAGTSSFTVKADYGSGVSGTRDYTLTVGIGLTPTFLTSGFVGTAYSRTLTAVGSTGSTTFTMTSGSLPPGLSLSSSGLISGTPTSAGTSRFTIRVTDSSGSTGELTYSLTILATTGSLAKPTIVGTPAPGSTLTCSASGSFTYTWYDDGFLTATTQTWVVPADSVGDSVTCRITSTAGTALSDAVKIAGSAGAPVNTVKPSISGTHSLGQTLTCWPGTWTGVSPTYSYQWLDDGFTIAGATTSTYVVTADTASDEVSCRVTATNTSGAASAVSDPLAPGATKAPPAGTAVPANTVKPFVTGTSAVGRTLTCSPGTWTGNPTTYAYQWLDDGVVIPGATASSYVVTAANSDDSLSCRVTASNTLGSAVATSDAIAPGATKTPPVGTPPPVGGGGTTTGGLANLTPPLVGGTALVGAPLSCTTGSWSGSPTSYAYQWLRSGVAIAGARSSRYVVKGADSSRTLACSVTASSSLGSATATSRAVAVGATGGVIVHRMIGGTGRADTITGSRAADTITGGRGNDRIFGGAGNDGLDGGAGNDRLSGGSGNDVIAGGPGDDRLTGGSGIDRLMGGADDDTILAADGRRDVISCGSGRDRVSADPADQVAPDCESVTRRRKAAGK